MAGPRTWKHFGRVHSAVYRLSGGRLGHHVPDGRRMLLLVTTGRKSGRTRTTPLVYMPHEEAFVVAASNGGAETEPAWWLNLKAQPEASVQVGERKLPVKARQLGADEASALWPKAEAYNDHWAGYRRDCKREIPLVLLEPR